MAIIASDIELRLSLKTGAAGDSGAGTPAGSLGKYISQTAIDAGTPLNNLFDDVSGAENAASDVEYRCLFVFNNHATLTYHSVGAYLLSQVSLGTTLKIAVDSTAASDHEAAGAQALEVADEGTAPLGLTFYAAATLGAALSLGEIAAGQVKAIWIERTAANTAALANDGGVLRITGGTEA